MSTVHHSKFVLLLGLLSAISLLFATDPVRSQNAGVEAASSVPLFRHIDPSKKDPKFKAYRVIRFAVTDDFPPFSYRTKNGALSGFNIAIANSVCRTLRVECRFMVKSFTGASKAVETGQVDAMITGLRETAKTGQVFSFTRPYYRFSARFAVRQSTSIASNDVRTLAGKRLGAVAGTYHAQFLKDNFRYSKIREYASLAKSYEALRTGAVDALFGDSLKLMFWIKGDRSKNCCRFAGDAYLDPQTFSPPMAIAVKRGNKKLLDLLDHALDRQQVSGRFSKIFRQYFPLSPWLSDKAEKPATKESAS